MIHPVTAELTYRADRTPLVAPGQMDCHVRDMTATIAADLPLWRVQKVLAEHGQWLPIDGDASQPIGALVSVDTSGPLRLGFGAWRDLLLGAQFTNGKGDLITAGGRTVKNVAGYDLTKFMVGQRDIFGKLVTITTRTYRRPAGAVVVRLPPDALNVGKLFPSPFRPQWALLTPEALWLGYLGDEASLDFYQRSLSLPALRGRAGVGVADQSRSPLQSSNEPPPQPSHGLPGEGADVPSTVVRRSLEEDIAHRAKLWNIDGSIVFRASIPPARLNELGPAIAAVHWSAADAAFGVVVGAVDSESSAELVAAAVTALQGTIKLSGGMFGKLISVTTTTAERHLLERLKAAFDPDNRLNPLPWTAS
jgi:FAD/FMN-containing dehydrogenase